MLHRPSSSTPARARSLGLFAALCVACSLALGSACDPALQSIAVTAQKTSLAKGTTVRLSAQGTFSDGTTGDLSSLATWSSANAAIITVSAAGLATGAAAGQTTVVASYKGVTGSLSLTTTAATLTSVAVVPPVASIALGTTQGFTAVGTFSDGTVQDVTGAAAWSADQAVATLTGPTPSALTATGIAAGQTAVQAVLMGQSGGAALVVTTAALTGLTVTPAVVSLAQGTTAQLKATGAFSDGTTQDLSSLVTWHSASTAVAVVTSSPGSPPSGLLTAKGPGQVLVTAALGPIHGSTSCTVTAAALVSIAVTPQAPVLAQGTAAQIVAAGTFSDGTIQLLTDGVTWTSSQTEVGTVAGDATGAGQVSAVAQGTATLTATVMDVSGTAALTVTEARLTSIEVTAASTALPAGGTTQLTATGTFSDNSPQDLTSQVAWHSDSPGVQIGALGLLKATAVGPAVVTATLGAVASPPLDLTVGSAVLVSIAVTAATPQALQIAKGASVQLTATGTYSDGSKLPLTASLSWQTAADTIAGIIGPGLVFGAGPGVAVITAVDPPTGISGSATISVTVAALQSIAVSAVSTALTLGTTTQLTATGTYSDGNQRPITGLVQWRSSDDTIAQPGPVPWIITGVGPGVATLFATDPQTGVSGTIDLSVVAAGPALASLTIAPDPAFVSSGGTLGFTATGTYADGSQQDLSSQVTWSSGSPAVATISNAAGTHGLAAAVALMGTTVISAHLGGVLAPPVLLTVVESLFSH